MHPFFLTIWIIIFELSKKFDVCIANSRNSPKIILEMKGINQIDYNSNH